jgi:hypothetical protein
MAKWSNSQIRERERICELDHLGAYAASSVEAAFRRKP